MRKFAKKGILIGEGTWVSYKAYIDSHNPEKINIGENCFISKNVSGNNNTDVKWGGPENISKDSVGKRGFKDIMVGDALPTLQEIFLMLGVQLGLDYFMRTQSAITKEVTDGKSLIIFLPTITLTIEMSL